MVICDPLPDDHKRMHMSFSPVSDVSTHVELYSSSCTYAPIPKRAILASTMCELFGSLVRGNQSVFRSGLNGFTRVTGQSPTPGAAAESFYIFFRGFGSYLSFLSVFTTFQSF